MWFSNIHIRLKLTNISLGFSADEKAASVQADFIEEGVPRRPRSLPQTSFAVSLAFLDHIE